MKSSLKLAQVYVLKAITERAHSTPEFIPSEYWTDFARNFRYVYELSEAELNRIRFHTYHLTSDSYLSYYFADEPLKNLFRNGYRHFTERNNLALLDEGGDGIGVETELGRISHDLLRYLGVINDLIDAKLLEQDTPSTVIEIGGGYGGLARAHMANNKQTAYIICDLEETLFFSAVYLSKHLGADKVHLVARELVGSEIEKGHVYIVPQSKISYLDHLRFDYAISQQSIQEMTHQQVERYLQWLQKRSSYLYSCNVADHAAIAKAKHLVLDLPALLKSHFSTPVWLGTEPKDNERFGDNHLQRAVYKCQ